MRTKIFSTCYHALFFIGGSLLFLLACSQEKSKQATGFPPAPVSVASSASASVPVLLHAIGNVDAYSTVGVRSRVGGELLRVNFREGQDVKKGDLLFAIDPGPYQTALEAAQANLLKDTALAKKAANDAVRYTALFQDQLVSRDDYERILSTAEALNAAVEADKALVENARLQLGYCSINAPISGRTGTILADLGNLIKANDDRPMVTINQIQPIYVSFSVPEQDLPEIRKHMTLGKVAVEAFITGDERPEEGTLTFVDNTVDPATGTIVLKATFDNRERALWPGQFVNVQMTLTTIREAVVVPSQAVQTGQQGQFVFVIKEGLAELRPVKPGITYKNMTVIENGLSPDEQVVTDGQIRVMPGAKVEIKNRQ
ncbi:MAG: efflux RND transporter periplasmic adaptor subunit [Nitrospiraceae bacterium]|nr:MAG: efflux RND transporter periplasmic adaptor subunit [Nitrospiraceae bacterium]